MAAQASKKRKRKARKLLKKLGIFGTIAVVLIAALGYLYASGLLEEWFSPKEEEPPIEGSVEFHFIDVGQGDAALIRTEEGDVLIDAGTNASEEALIAYLKAEGVTELAYAIFTHPHEDHIGGADAVLEYCKVEKVILPDATANTKVFERMMDGIEKQGAEVIKATPDAVYQVGDLMLTVLAPNAQKYQDLNNYSVVLRADFGDTSVLFTGDAEDVSEQEMLQRYGMSRMLRCDLLKVGHHGSDSSTTEEFLKAVSPKYAVISCGEGNDYGHPKQSILKRLGAENVTYWRTDLEGSIVVISDGAELRKE